MLEKKQTTTERCFNCGIYNKCSSIDLSQIVINFPEKKLNKWKWFCSIFSKKDLQHKYDDYVSSDMLWNEFKVYTEQIRDHSFLVINKDFDIFNGKYLYIKNFN